MSGARHHLSHLSTPASWLTAVIIFLSGEQEVPHDVRRVIIDQSVKIIPKKAFYQRQQLVSVKMHDGVEIVGRWAFSRCTSLRQLKLPGVKEVRYMAFYDCGALADVEFGDKLETIGSNAFFRCHIKSRGDATPDIQISNLFYFIHY
eukprot:scaffold4934_cov69-Skeletonema_marinoi.AAC.1